MNIDARTVPRVGRMLNYAKRAIPLLARRLGSAVADATSLFQHPGQVSCPKLLHSA
jgi:hypothetical protein